MKAEMVLRARLAEGGVFLEFPQNEGLKEALKKAALQCERKANGWALITLQPPKRPRTTGEGSQNHHLNGHIGQIALETGNGQTAVKLVVKELAVEQFGYPTVKVGKKTVPQSESECSTEECGMLIEACHLLAADLGIILREAEE